MYSQRSEVSFVLAMCQQRIRYSVLVCLLLPAAAVSQSWTQLMPSGSPPAPRADATTVYDPGSNRMILFGGSTAGCTFSPSVNDTWILTGANGTGAASWNPLTTSGGPPGGRRGHSAIYNRTTNRMVIYSGDPVGCAVSRYTDVWVLTHANGLGGTPTWMQLSPTGPTPPGRSEFAYAYDEANNRMIVYGGFGPAGNLTDTWVLEHADGSTGVPNWVQLSPPSPPSFSSLGTAVYDPGSNRMILAGGGACCTSVASPFRVWVLSNANGLGGPPSYTLLAPTGTPPSPRIGLRAGYDAAANVMYLFAGQKDVGGGSNEVFALSDANGLGAPHFSLLSPAGPAPLPRGGVVGAPSAVFDSAGRRLTIFGGAGAIGLFNDTWVLALVTDSTPPVIQPQVSGAMGANGWYTGNVNVAWNVSDAESDVTATAGCGAQTLVSDTTGTTLTCSATSGGGTSSESITIKRDATIPFVTLTGPSDGAVYALGSVPAAACLTNDATSGVDTPAALTATGGDGAGPHTATCSGARDLAGNAAPPVSVSYFVQHHFIGFLAPVRMGVLNSINAGQAVPLKWQLLGEGGQPAGPLNAVVSLSSSAFNCSTGVLESAEIPLVFTGASGLRYDPIAGQFIAVWNTAKAWARSCRRVFLKLDDGSVHSADFQLR